MADTTEVTDAAPDRDADGLPIIYVRGYAGNQSGVEATVADPFYGFNTGATHARVDDEGRAEFFAFESPLVRLMTDHGYRDVYEDGRQPHVEQRRERDTPGRRSIWVFRYYDATSRSFHDSEGERWDMETIAEELRRFVALVKERTGAPKVVLVCHSMGGLVARCLIQKVYREHAHRDAREAGGSATDPMPAFAHIDRVFTYATPHGGIHFDNLGGQIAAMARDLFGRRRRADVFGRRRMRQYLTRAPEAGGQTGDDASFDPIDLDGSFPPERFFCLVGTNARDYEVAFGLSRTAVGPNSDGLVLIEHAYVRGAPRAYVHRAHSGPYGIVNSEEGYQNLQRFLFGNMRVRIELDHLDEILAKDRDHRITHQAEAQVAIRQLPVLMHDQMVSHHSPILLELEKAEQGLPIPLFEVFLMADQAPDRRTCRYALRLGIHRFRRARDGSLQLDQHLEQMPLWTDQLVVDLRSEDDGTYGGTWAWRSELKEPDADPGRELGWESQDGTQQVRLPLPAHGRDVLGERAEIVLTASPWS